jgi:hypothetical protein
MLCAHETYNYIYVVMFVMNKIVLHANGLIVSSMLVQCIGYRHTLYVCMSKNGNTYSRILKIEVLE